MSVEGREGPLAGDWCCEYCEACFSSCAELARHIHDQHPGQAFPNCCGSDADCIALFGPGYDCVDGTCVKVVETYPMSIGARCDSDRTQVGFTINGASKTTPYAESLEAGLYTIVMPSKVTYQGAEYIFDKWGDGVTGRTRAVSHPLTTYPDKYTGLTAHYSMTTPPPGKYTLAISHSVEGYTSPIDTGTYLYAEGTVLTIWAVPSAGNVVGTWTLDGVKQPPPPGMEVLNPITVHMNKNHTLFHTFNVAPPPPECTVDSDCPEGYICKNGVCVEAAPPPEPPTLWEQLVEWWSHRSNPEKALIIGAPTLGVILLLPRRPPAYYPPPPYYTPPTPP